MDDDDYDIRVSVVKQDKQTAELVYIVRTPIGEPTYDVIVKVNNVEDADVSVYDLADDEITRLPTRFPPATPLNIKASPIRLARRSLSPAPSTAMT